MKRRVFVACATAVILTACSSGTDKLCTPREQLCSGNVLKTCNLDGKAYTDKTCTGICLNSTCQPCVPSEAHCEAAVSRVCKTDGSGWTQDTCSTGCDSSTGRCRTQACTPGEVHCSASSLVTCKSDGSGTTEQPCTYGCDYVNKVCHPAACVGGTTSCNGSKLVTCNQDGSGITETMCDFGCSTTPSPAKCKDPACGAGENRCSATNSKQVETCNATRTAWINGPFCNSGVCTGGVCTCVPTEEICRKAVSYHLDEIDRCDANGHWVKAAESCMSGDCIDEGGTPKQFSCGACWAGERSCGHLDVYDCPDPSVEPIVPILTCEDTEICTYGACATLLTLPAGTEGDSYKEIIRKVVACWHTNADVLHPSANNMCYKMDRTNQPAELNFANLVDWVCNSTAAEFENVATDLTSDAAWSKAKDLAGCGWFNDSEIFWLWNPMPDYDQSDACVWYHPVTGQDQLVIDHCTKYWK
jgi:hypothetical protein